MSKSKALFTTENYIVLCKDNVVRGQKYKILQLVVEGKIEGKRC